MEGRGGREGRHCGREDGMNKQSCFSSSWRLHLALIACMLPLPRLSPCCSDPLLLFLFTYFLLCLSVPSPRPSQHPRLQVLPVHSSVLSFPPPMIPLLLSLPLPKRPRILADDDPVNPLPFSNHPYPHACPGNKHTCIHVQAHTATLTQLERKHKTRRISYLQWATL